MYSSQIHYRQLLCSGLLENASFRGHYNALEERAVGLGMKKYHAMSLDYNTCIKYLRWQDLNYLLNESFYLLVILHLFHG